MALSRFIFKNLTQTSSNSFKIKPHPWPWNSQRVCTTHHHLNQQQPDTKEVSISEKPKLFSPKRSRRRSLWARNNQPKNFPPLSGVGNAIVAAAANMNKLLESLSPFHLIRRMKEKDESYNIKYQMPGLSKDDVKITIEDGVLFIRGEHKEEAEAEEGDDDEWWSAASYGYYNTSLMLPEDAKVEEIKAEMKDGVLHVIIPKDETKNKHIKEVQIG